MKELSDVCVTSANAVKIVKALPNKNIFFIPDRNLAHFIAEQIPEKNFIYNEGFCIVHEFMDPEEVKKVKEEFMNLGIIAHNSKKVLIEDFCIAYKNILAKHEVYATGTTGRRIEEATGLHVHKFLPGSIGGDKQFMEMVERQDLDMVILFYNPVMIDPKEPDITAIVKRCDQYNIPVATNIATAELLILGLARGDLDWRLNLK